MHVPLAEAHAPRMFREFADARLIGMFFTENDGNEEDRFLR
jgi:hypothetical protein